MNTNNNSSAGEIFWAPFLASMNAQELTLMRSIFPSRHFRLVFEIALNVFKEMRADRYEVSN